MERREANFTTPNALDTAISQYAAPVLTPTLQEATVKALDDSDEDDGLGKLHLYRLVNRNRRPARRDRQP
jgi:hypothetical protein